MNRLNSFEFSRGYPISAPDVRVVHALGRRSIDGLADMASVTGELAADVMGAFVGATVGRPVLMTAGVSPVESIPPIPQAVTELPVFRADDWRMAA